VHHRIVDELVQYKYSSYNLLAGENATKLCRAEVLGWFGGKENYIKFHKEMERNYFSDDFMIED